MKTVNKNLNYKLGLLKLAVLVSTKYYTSALFSIDLILQFVKKDIS